MGNITSVKNLTQNYLKNRLQDCFKKYRDRDVNGMRGVWRGLQDNISFMKHGIGYIRISEGVEKVLKEKGNLPRKDFVFEHKVPFKLYKRDVHSLFQEGKLEESLELLWDKTDLILITPQEDNRIKDKGLVSRVPNKGDRYEVSGIKISDKLIHFSDINWKDKQTRSQKQKNAS